MAKIDPAIDSASDGGVCAYDAERCSTFDVKLVRALVRPGLPASGPRGGCRHWGRPLDHRKTLNSKALGTWSTSSLA